MHHDTQTAAKMLKEGSYTCVFCKGDSYITSTERGVKPLLRLIETKRNVHDFSVADKVVGKAAALLYVLLGVKEVYAIVISKAASEVLHKNGIPFTCGTETPAIRNRTNTGFCPMEETVREIEDPYLAYDAVCRKLKEIENPS